MVCPNFCTCVLFHSTNSLQYMCRKKCDIILGRPAYPAQREGSKRARQEEEEKQRGRGEERSFSCRQESCKEQKREGERGKSPNKKGGEKLNNNNKEQDAGRCVSLAGCESGVRILGVQRQSSEKPGGEPGLLRRNPRSRRSL